MARVGAGFEGQAQSGSDKPLVPCRASLHPRSPRPRTPVRPELVEGPCGPPSLPRQAQDDRGICATNPHGVARFSLLSAHAIPPGWYRGLNARRRRPPAALRVHGSHTRLFDEKGEGSFEVPAHGPWRGRAIGRPPPPQHRVAKAIGIAQRGIDKFCAGECGITAYTAVRQRHAVRQRLVTVLPPVHDR